MPSKKMQRNSSTGFVALLGAVALASGAFYACESDDGGAVLPSDGGSTATTTPTGAGGSGLGMGGSVGGFDPNPNICRGHSGEVVCDKDVAITCDDNENRVDEQDCGDEVCVPGTGCLLCVAGQYKCEGNEVYQCDAGPPLNWVLVTTCNPASSERCSSAMGSCVAVAPIGNGPSDPTGVYYEYARFDEGVGDYRGGHDVDCYGDIIYVNRDGSNLDVYRVELLDSDGDGEFEPNQHPDNPDDTGPVERRLLTHIAEYQVPMGNPSRAELFATEDRIYFLRSFGTNPEPGDIFEYIFATGQINKVVDADGSLGFAQMGYDDVNDIWYASSESARRVFSFHAPSNSWVLEFEYPNMAGSHMDGQEVVMDPNTGTVYNYVSDMTSDFIGQYIRDRGDTWVQVNLFQYQGTGDDVEGFGYGALNHFWATGWTALYEVGGGDLAKFTEPEPVPR